MSKGKFKLPKRYKFSEIESKWIQYWKENNIYKFDVNVKDKEIFSIDTPPPFTSGTLHMGHILIIHGSTLPHGLNV